MGARDPGTIGFGGWMVCDSDNNGLAGSRPHRFSMTLRDVENYLAGHD